LFDIRASLAPLAAPAGLVLAFGLWLALGGHSPADDQMAGVGARLDNVRPVVNRAAANADVAAAARALASPVFALTTGPGAVPDTPVALTGIAVTGTRKAALISIGGKPADWLDLGATRDGVTVMTINAAGVTVDTATGFKTVGLSSGPASSPAAAK